MRWGGGAEIYKTLLTFLAVITPQTKEGESQILRQLGVRQKLSLCLFSREHSLAFASCPVARGACAVLHSYFQFTLNKYLLKQ